MTDAYGSPPLTGRTWSVYRFRNGEWRLISRRWQTPAQALAYRETLPTDWVCEVRAVEEIK